jgi:hypothetical protein
MGAVWQVADVSAPLGVWLVARTPISQKYPCRCAEHGGRSCGTQWCPCWGRQDIDGLPPECCAPRWFSR